VQVVSIAANRMVPAAESLLDRMLLWLAFNASEVSQVNRKSCLNTKLIVNIRELQRQIKCTQWFIAPTQKAILTDVYFGGWSS
ncbi:MAG: hypothetical protein MUQ52_12080, partial [Pirellulales bacterium]|nr:hypothetical protein [Pirellulales bacterium]